MDTPSWKKKLAAFGLVGGLAAIVAVALTMFAGGFTSTVPLTVTSPRSGLVMEPDAKVKMRGVEVGRVASIEHTPAGAVLHLDMQPGQMQLIPSNARVAIESTTVFGAKFVDIVVPDDPSSVPMQEGAVIAADNVTVEFNTVFEHLSDVLAQIQPEKLNATLGALSEALNGRGNALGAALAEADAYLAEMNPSLPQLQADLVSAAQVTDVYADTAPDLMTTIGNATDVGNTVVDEQQQLDLLLMNLTGLANTGRDVLGENEAQLTTALDSLSHTTGLLGEYSPELTCFIVGLNDARVAFEPMAGTGEYAALTLSTSFMGGATPYNDAQDLPVVGATGGPNCWGLPNFDPRRDGHAPFVVSNTGETPYKPATEAWIRYPTIFQYLFGDHLAGGR
ncbi:MULTISPECIES: MCE family protein [Rhodococcus]|uniref:MCE family protein n=1 Tax=Rhodococcus rhodochrous TaxID=1829 RepID=A0AAW4XBS4_RHORH|nr:MULTISPECIES: MCE family protein [Rhodococcus]MCD2110373.1 MCE family protein [Rhodococcus rhodochrous]QHG80892.1 MCE family protein [Rhodococcus rhodochrous]QOH55097.1 Mce family protein [Rhodococcus rhodochrous]WAL47168.1 MCE family protein [Rhodococcus pyridinivorans]